jgi:hypothetical protein
MSIQSEINTVKLMVELYCRKNHHCSTVCVNCNSLLTYSIKRLNKCKFGNSKPACKDCSVHCYYREMREEIRKVMRFSGPRMIWYHPFEAIKYLVT